MTALPPDPATASWPTSAAEAIALQRTLSSQVIRIDQLGAIRHVAGTDVGFEADGTITRAAVVVLRFPELTPVDWAIAKQPTCFPYIPGLLSFREVPAILAALQQLAIAPDLLLCDGQGLAHPRRFGLACHLGLLSGIAAIGVGKSRLCGQHDTVPDDRGGWIPLLHQGETIGAVLRSRPKTKPLYISLGHRISLTTAIEFVMACTTKYRLPETTRWAHQLASEPQRFAARMASLRSIGEAFSQGDGLSSLCYDRSDAASP